MMTLTIIVPSLAECSIMFMCVQTYCDGLNLRLLTIHKYHDLLSGLLAGHVTGPLTERADTVSVCRQLTSVCRQLDVACHTADNR